ncbi:MAG TPA: GMC oxidoreductase [Nitrospirota bacterium]|nr:GMC oxidoreductase [Nitrospirota bacterium]
MAIGQREHDYDFIIIGSGFGGSVSALRLAERGYKVLVIEKGKRLTEKDFPRTNWNLKKWFWLPVFRFFGFFKITWFRHVTILSGVGVGGGSLVYANTLPVPKPEFFKALSWAHLADWEQELKEFYPLATRMLGAVPCPRQETGDRALKTLAEQIGKAEGFEPTKVAVFFGEPEKTVPDPYFNGKGPERAGCVFCGGCMVGCRYNAKNTLDKNYLYLAEKLGTKIQAESEVFDVLPIGKRDGSEGYRVKWRPSLSFFKVKGEYTCQAIVFSGGVLGTVPLLLKLKESSLPDLSDRIGHYARTNSESLMGITAFAKETVFSDGVAISSILHTDEHSHLEPVRYPSGSGFWRLLGLPLAQGSTVLIRLAKTAFDMVRHPIKNLRVFLVRDWAKRTQILLFMRTLDSTFRFSRGIFGMKTSTDTGEKPTAFMPEARALAERYAAIVNGKPMALLTETLFVIPTTAHILGGCVMGKDRNEGVIDRDNRVFGYENMYVCDGTMISANPGVNPSLTITALTERAMSKISEKSEYT